MALRPTLLISRHSLLITDAGAAIKDLDFSAKMNRADGLIVVAPEYNHGCPGLLKHLLDSCLTEYIHKAWESWAYPRDRSVEAGSSRVFCQ